MSEDTHHGPGYYLKIYGILLVLLVISIIGPEIGIKWVTLVTAFGIAVVKALMVAAYFMHLNVEKRYIHYMLYTMLIFVALFWIAVAPDVMNLTGTQWENKSAIQHIEANAGKTGDEH